MRLCRRVLESGRLVEEQDLHRPLRAVALLRDDTSGVSPAESSTQIGALASSPTTFAKWAYSCDCSIPLRSLCASICPREHSMRCANCCLDISRLNTAQGSSELAATCSITFIAIAVL